MTEVGLVGPGVLGRTLALSLPADSYVIGPVLSSSKVSSRRAVREMKRGFATTDWEDFSGTSTILVTAPQDQLAEILHAAADRVPQPSDRRFLLSGVVCRSVRDAISRLESMGAHVGGVLPIAHYRRPSLISPKTSFAIWGSPAALRSAREIVKALRGRQATISQQAVSESLLAVALVSGALTTSFELAIRSLVRAGFPRSRAIEALAPLTEAGIQEHRRSRSHAPAHRFPAACPELFQAVERADPASALIYQAALRLAYEEMP